MSYATALRAKTRYSNVLCWISRVPLGHIHSALELKRSLVAAKSSAETLHSAENGHSCRDKASELALRGEWNVESFGSIRGFVHC